MKKTLLALAALAGIACANETLTFATANSVNGANGGAYHGVVFSLEAAAGNLATSSTSDIPAELALDSIAITMRNNNAAVNVGTYKLYVINAATKEIVAKSTNTQTTTTPLTGQVITFAFDGELLDTSATYNARFVGNENIVVKADGTYDTSKYWSLQLGVAQVTEGNTQNWGMTGVIKGIDSGTAACDTNYTPLVTITTHTPEPATTTLSLLAFAGLASRRRRH